MREILFRGKRKDNGEWVHGDLVRTTRESDGIRSDHSLIGVDMVFHEVIPETVGQYTGLKDRNGKEIYEGDILGEWVDTDEGMIQSKQQVFWKNGGWWIDASFNQDRLFFYTLYLELEDYDYEVIGNIYENQ